MKGETGPEPFANNGPDARRKTMMGKSGGMKGKASVKTAKQEAAELKRDLATLKRNDAELVKALAQLVKARKTMRNALHAVWSAAGDTKDTLALFFDKAADDAHGWMDAVESWSDMDDLGSVGDFDRQVDAILDKAAKARKHVAKVRS